mgnify:CR=1 FL=1
MIALEDLKKVIAKVDVITINDEEARQLSGEYSLVTAAQKISAMGPRFVVIKKGEHGALLFEDDKVFFAPALPLEEVFDPTGAGDTFAGGFMGYLASKNDLSNASMRRAMLVGTVMASFAVQDFSLDGLIRADKQEIEKRYEALRTLTRTGPLSS